MKMDLAQAEREEEGIMDIKKRLQGIRDRLKELKSMAGSAVRRERWEMRQQEKHLTGTKCGHDGSKKGHAKGAFGGDPYLRISEGAYKKALKPAEMRAKYPKLKKVTS